MRAQTRAHMQGVCAFIHGRPTHPIRACLSAIGMPVGEVGPEPTTFKEARSLTFTGDWVSGEGTEFDGLRQFETFDEHA